MLLAARSRYQSTDEWAQILLLVTSQKQEAYEASAAFDTALFKQSTETSARLLRTSRFLL